MSETPTIAPVKPKSPPRTRPCKNCGYQMPAARSVCPDCGHMTRWFKLRLIVGGGFLLLGGITLIIEFILALRGNSGN